MYSGLRILTINGVWLTAINSKSKSHKQQVGADNYRANFKFTVDSILTSDNGLIALQ